MGDECPVTVRVCMCAVIEATALRKVDKSVEYRRREIARN